MASDLFDLTGRPRWSPARPAASGLAMARGLAEAGAAIVLNGRDEKKLAGTVDALKAQGHRVSASAFDVADEPAVIAAFPGFRRRGRRIDILVNNAGITVRKPMIELATEEWRKVVETNLTSAFVVGREAARRMIAGGAGGKIINIVSLASEIARATIAPYNSAKGGLKMLTRSMAGGMGFARHSGERNRPRLYRDRDDRATAG